MTISADPPIRTSLLVNLTAQSTLITELFTAIPQPSASAAVPQLHAALAQSSTQLQALAQEAEEHQRRWAVLLEKKREVEMLERKVRGLVRELAAGKVELEAMVDEGRRAREHMEKSEKDLVTVPVLLAHAHALSRTTSMPVSSLLAPVDLANATPWPTEQIMRNGLLFQMNGSMSGVGDVGVVGEEKPVAAQQDHHEVMHEDTGRRYDPGAVFSLELNSDDSSDDE